MINYNEPETIQDEFGADVNASIEMFFRNRLDGTSLDMANSVIA